MKNPCYKCPERTLNCKPDCKKRKIWAIKNEIIKRRKIKQREKDLAIITPAYERVHNNALKRKLQGRRKPHE